MGIAFDIEYLIRLVHQIRWDEQFPKEYEGYPWNYIMEDVVDTLMEYERLWREVHGPRLDLRRKVDLASEPDEWGHCKHCGRAVAENLQLQHGDGTPMWTHVKVLNNFCQGAESWEPLDAER